MKIPKRLVAVGAAGLLAALMPVGRASTAGGFKHVLLISIDGMHALDYENCVATIIVPISQR